MPNEADTVTMADESSFKGVLEFADFYATFHPYLAIPVCSVSIVTNSLNAAVLSSKQMLNGSNTFLLVMAICYNLMNIIYLATVVHDFLQQNSSSCESYLFSYSWSVTVLLSSNLSFTLHGLAAWLTVGLAMFRCLQLKKRSGKLYSCSSAAKSVVLIALVTVLFCLPNYCSFSIVRVSIEQSSFVCTASTNHSNSHLWIIDSSKLIYPLDMLAIAFLISAIIFFIMPCCLLAVAFCYLLHKLGRFRKIHRHLTRRDLVRCAHIDNQTVVLLVILAIFVTTQLPQGILTLLCSVLSEDYCQNVYQSLGQLMELLSITNGLVSFLCHCIMSSKFRNQFRRIILHTTHSSEIRPIVVGRE